MSLSFLSGTSVFSTLHYSLHLLLCRIFSIFQLFSPSHSLSLCLTVSPSLFPVSSFFPSSVIPRVQTTQKHGATRTSPRDPICTPVPVRQPRASRSPLPNRTAHSLLHPLSPSFYSDSCESAIAHQAASDHAMSPSLSFAVAPLARKPFR